VQQAAIFEANNHLPVSLHLTQVQKTFWNGKRVEKESVVNGIDGTHSL